MRVFRTFCGERGFDRKKLQLKPKMGESRHLFAGALNHRTRTPV
jgi:hypothetical protein